VRTISVTDGEKVGAMGDLGVQVGQAAAPAPGAQQLDNTHTTATPAAAIGVHTTGAAEPV
jgi:hypothetical protein